MIKHVDVVAIAVLLAGAALYSEARNLRVIQAVPAQRIALTRTIQRAVRCGRSALAQRAICARQAAAGPVTARIVAASE